MGQQERERFQVARRGARIAGLGFAVALGACGHDEAARVADAPASGTLDCATASANGAASDLARFARLNASGTRDGDDGRGAIESRDAIATIRDDSGKTGWKVPLGDSSVELDFQPWLGRPVSLAQAAVKFDGPVPATVAVELLDACGGSVLATVPWPEPGAALDLGDACAACVRIRLSTNVDTTLTLLELLTHDDALASQLGAVESRALPDGPPPITQPNSGVIEGFYGVPWSWRERKDMLVSMALGGLGLYLYAPKDDELHRGEWRVPYPDEEITKFGVFASLANEFGITPYFGVSPFGDYDSANEHDYDALLDKLLSLASAGFTGVAILADDIDLFASVDVGGDLGAAHAAVVKRLVGDLRAQFGSTKFIFVPTVYNGAQLNRRGSEGVAYLEALATLDADVQIMWTGAGVFADTMTSTEMLAVAAAIRRDPLIWDNYWANDATDAAYGRILLAPLRGRDATLPAAVSGLGFNPSIQGALSRLAVSTAAEFLRAPKDYDADAARAAAANTERTFIDAQRPDDLPESGATDTARFAMELFDGHGLHVPDNAALYIAHATLEHDLNKSPYVGTFVGKQMLAVVARMAVFDSELHHSALLADFVDELAFPAAKVRHEGEAGLWLMRALGERNSNRDATDSLARAQAALDASAATRFKLGVGELESLRDQIAALPNDDQGFEEVALSDDAPPDCRLGGELSWKPFAIAPNAVPIDVEAFGMAGASAEADAIRWTPPHAGRFRVVAIAGRADDTPGWNFRQHEFLCLP